MTRKEYREWLNKEYGINPSGKGFKGRYKARTRSYGDYLWYQDRWMFEISYQDHLTEHGLTEKN